MKEELSKYLNIRVPRTLFEKFRAACDMNYKTISESLRDFMQKYVKDNEIENKEK